MEEEKIGTSIVPRFDEATRSYQVANYPEVARAVNDYIRNSCLQDLIVQNEGDFKAVKEKRTEIRKHKEDIATARKKVNAMLLGDFNNQLFTLEHALDGADKVLKAKVDEWNEKEKGKEALESITVYSIDKDVLEQVRKYAVKKGCIVK